MRSSIVSLAALAGIVSASPALDIRNNNKNQAGYSPRVGPDNANCERKTYSVSVSSNNTVYTNVESNFNETQLTDVLFSFLTTTANNFTDTYQNGGKRTVDATYQISGTLCTPKSGAKNSDAVQLLVHGIGFDSSYWDFALSDEYSYVWHAANAGKTTFRYDRLGTGLSEHPSDAYNVVQAETDLAILTKFVEMLRGGKIGKKAFNKIAGIGHSYGSVQFEALTSRNPTAVDAVVLTGFSANATAVPVYLSSTAYSTASIIAPQRFGSAGLTNAYLITATAWTSALNFLYYGGYTPAAAQLARATEQPVTQGVLFTFANLLAPAPKFTGPVHVVTGDKDFIFCYGNCYNVGNSGLPNIPAGVKTLYPATSKFSTYIPANTGHGITAHKSQPAVSEHIIQYLSGVGF